jgi:hypothetical protein
MVKEKCMLYLWIASNLMFVLPKDMLFFRHGKRVHNTALVMPTESKQNS